MTLVSVMVLTIAVTALILAGALAFATSPGGDAGRYLRRSGTAVLCLGFGLVLLLAAPADLYAPVRVFGDALWMLSCGLFWGAARLLNRRPAPFEAVLAGALAWLLVTSLLDPSQAWRGGAISTLVAGYSLATAWEHRAGDTVAEPVRRWAARIFAAHGGLFLLRAILGPASGLAPWGPEVAAGWGVVLGVEVAGVGILAAGASVALSRRRAAGLHRPDSLDDGLTGIGNRRALSRSGASLFAATRAAGRPVALLMMDLDGFEVLVARHGGPAGDRLLVAFARLAHDYLPPTSLVCRIGGETFAAVLPGAEVARARAIADELRALFAHLAIPGPQGPVRTTVSIGVAATEAMGGAEAEAPDRGFGALFARADLCRAAAREGGRDRVVVADGPSAPPRHRAA